MTTLAQYERARAALAEATRIDQVLPILDEVEHVKLYARQIRDQALLADASEFQMRAERRLGIVISEAKKAGHFPQHRPKAKNNGNTGEPLPVTLEDVGVSKRLSSTAQKRASISEQAFEATVRGMRERIAAGRAKIIEAEPLNGARSVMGSRAEPADSLDYFPTPPWATRALVERVLRRSGHAASFHAQTAWEPACGEGHMAEVLREYFGGVRATDIHDYGYGDQVLDFLSSEANAVQADWVVTNPPFGDSAEAFVLKAIERARVGVAMFLRLQWLESIGRYERVFQPHPPAVIAQFAERVPLHKGRWEPQGTTATAYLWIVWLKQASGPRRTEFFWIPPGQRDALTYDDDVERFTACPVIRAERVECDEPFDPDTGEIAPAAVDGTSGASAGYAPRVSTSTLAAAAPVISPASPAGAAAAPLDGTRVPGDDAHGGQPQPAPPAAAPGLPHFPQTGAAAPSSSIASPAGPIDDGLTIPDFLRRAG